MNVTAVRIGYNPESLEWVLRFFMDSEILAAMPDENQNMRSLYDVGKAMEHGSSIMYVPMVDDQPVGLFWGSFFGTNTIEGHWGILAKHRKRGVAKAACDAVFDLLADDFPEVTNVIGQVAKCNTACYAGALRCGFEVLGTLPRSHRKEGTVYDSWILRREIM
jgi:RimJ/RimL family protein N-acetyltransferase